MSEANYEAIRDALTQRHRLGIDDYIIAQVPALLTEIERLRAELRIFADYGTKGSAP
jgi:hypothetical protein